MHPNAYPLPRPRTPGCVTAARVAAGVQAAMLAGFTALAGVFALLALSTGPGEGGLADFLAFVALVAGGLLVVPLLLIGIPLLMLRPGRPGARVALIVGESISVAAAVLLLGAQGGDYVLESIGGPVGMYLVLGVTTIVGLAQSDAQAWSAA